MTTIIWTPGFLAADRQVCGDVIFTTTKIKVIRGHATAFCGEVGLGLTLQNWFSSGGVKEEFPEIPENEELLAELICANVTGALTWVSSPYPEIFEMPFLAWGTGGPSAMSALRAGANIGQAMSIAAACDHNTGQGYDLVNLRDPALKIQQFSMHPMNSAGIVT